MVVCAQFERCSHWFDKQCLLIIWKGGRIAKYVSKSNDVMRGT